MGDDEMKPRSYQTQIESIAINENSIIYLPTGSGKTFIAIQIMKRLQEFTKPPYSKGSKRMFFLVNTIPLVSQHLKVVENLSSLTVRGFTSQDKVDLWDQTEWLQQMENVQVLIMTSQILCDMLLHNYIQLNRINLIIFDECHAAVKDHPMRQIMRRFENTPLNETPRVIGLTATILNGNVKANDVEASIKELEKTFRSKIITCDVIEEVNSYSTKPCEIMICYAPYTYSAVDVEVQNTLKKNIELLKVVTLNEDRPYGVIENYKELVSKNKQRTKLIRLFSTVLRHITDLGTYGTSIAILASIIRVERIKLKADFEIQPLLKNITTSSNHSRGYIQKNSLIYDRPYDNIFNNSSPKLKSLLSILIEYSPNALADTSETKTINKYNEELCCIIFVKERMTALVLHIFLKHIKQNNKEFEFLKQNFITGYNTNPFSDTREDLFEKKQNKLVVNEFRMGLLNCLISTDILEEGFDLPQCNLIIRFDELMSFKSYIQSKGRGRQSTASYVILLPNVKKDEFSKILDSYQAVFKTVNDMLIGKTRDRLAPTEEEIAIVYKNICEPYQHNNATITAGSAISLLNRYCSSLDHDIFTDPQPLWLRKHTCKNKNELIISIRMPSNSPLKKIVEGPPMRNIKEAKQVTALLACKELHKIGELNENLLPQDRVQTVFDDISTKNLFLHWDNENDNGPNKSMFKKIKEKYYKKEFPKCFKRLNDNIPTDTYYMHSIQITPKWESTDAQLCKVYEMLESNMGYAFITKNPMEQICPFSLFLSSGEVDIEITPKNTPCNIPSSLLNKIKRFHVMLFYDVLTISQPFLTLGNSSSDNYFFIVPTRKFDGINEIDEETLDTYKSIEKCEEPSVDYRRQLKVNKEEYLHRIITPWYRADNTIRYIVTEVCDDISPHSSFSTPQFKSFAEYFSSKYNLHIVGEQNQPMLKVRPIGGKMNCLLPRSITYAIEENLSKKKLKMILEATSMDIPSHDELLVPEFCFRFNFPGVLWLKAILLPSVIHRVTNLLQAEELRQKIAEEIQLGCLNLKDGEKWIPLTVDIHAIKVSQKAVLTSKSAKDSYDESPDSPASDSNHSKAAAKQETISTNFQFTKSSIDAEFPWNPNSEPIDINRSIDNVSVMDIECFDKFVSQTVPTKDQKESCISSLSLKETIPAYVSKRAIRAPPHKYNNVITMLNKKISRTGPQLSSMLEALTVSRSNDVINLERLETLGDSFLKFGASLYLWHKYPHYAEGKLTTVKGKLVSNKNLYLCAQPINLAGRMKTKQFNARFGWLMPGFSFSNYILDWLTKCPTINPVSIYPINIPRHEVVSGALSENTKDEIKYIIQQYLDMGDETTFDVRDNNMEPYFVEVAVADKVISDCVEALIGLYLLDSGIEAAFRILSWLGILPKEENANDLMSIHLKTPYNEGKLSLAKANFQLDYCQNDIENILGYTFKDPSYLVQALSHSSNIKNNVTECYQRLEFIGDAILDFLITTYIYENCGSLSPGDITDLRSALVNNVTFACIIVKYGLHKYILSSNSALDAAILKFVLYQNERQHIIDDTVIFLLEEDDCTLSDYVDVPKALGDIFESLAGAVYFDSGNDLNTVWKVFYKFMYENIVLFSENIPKQPVRRLYEQIHSTPKFKESSVTVTGRVMVPLQFQVQGVHKTVHGFGVNKANAKRSAAKVALKMLGINSSH